MKSEWTDPDVGLQLSLYLGKKDEKGKRENFNIPVCYFQWPGLNKNYAIIQVVKLVPKKALRQQTELKYFTNLVSNEPSEILKIKPN